MRRRVEGHTDAVLCCQVLPGQLLVSGGEDAQLCFTDLNTLSNVGKIRQDHGDAVTSVCSSAANEHLVYASAGQSVLAVDLRKGFSEDAVCDVWSLNQDEINHIAVNRQGSWLAAGDDSGEVQVISLQPPRDAAGRPSYKTLRRGHSNICSAVAFRPHRPWELLSAGLDSTVVRWDFNRLRPQQTWNLNAEAAASGGQVFNPPMVHSVAVPDTEDRGLCRLMAVARGDGYISLYDIDSTPAVPPSGSSTSGGSGGGGKKGGSKAKAKQNGGRAGGGSGAAEPSQGSRAGGGDARPFGPAEPSRRSREVAAVGPTGEAAAAAAAAAAAEEAAWRVPLVPGRVGLLGREQGGHIAAVNCLAFMHGTDWQRLLSAGNDGRLLLWDWPAAARRQGSGWRAAQATKLGARTGAAEAAAHGGPEPQGSSEAGREGDGGPRAAGAAAADPGAAEAAPAVVADVRHGRKVNWVCSSEPVGGYNVFVADVSRRLTAMALR